MTDNCSKLTEDTNNYKDNEDKETPSFYGFENSSKGKL